MSVIPLRTSDLKPFAEIVACKGRATDSARCKSLIDLLTNSLREAVCGILDGDLSAGDDCACAVSDGSRNACARDLRIQWNRHTAE